MTSNKTFKPINFAFLKYKIYEISKFLFRNFFEFRDILAEIFNEIFEIHN
jgi:hypothetical protein